MVDLSTKQCTYLLLQMQTDAYYVTKSISIFMHKNMDTMLVTHVT